jgi:hypothetical protein
MVRLEENKVWTATANCVVQIITGSGYFKNKAGKEERPLVEGDKKKFEQGDRFRASPGGSDFLILEN